MEIKKQRTFHAYRGANEEWGKKWEYNKELKLSNGEDEYFGHGYYFFENDYSEAKNWAKNVRKIKTGNISIIYAYIESEKVYDLIDRETYNEYIKLIKIISERYENSDKKPNFNKPYDCKLINLISDENGYDMVKGIYYPNHRLGNEMLENGNTRMSKTHIQLCVRNKDIIQESKVEYL